MRVSKPATPPLGHLVLCTEKLMSTGITLLMHSKTLFIKLSMRWPMLGIRFSQWRGTESENKDDLSVNELEISKVKTLMRTRCLHVLFCLTQWTVFLSGETNVPSSVGNNPWSR